jgi:thiosulfate/3-mercaptopyruvate sulfurtransferase
MAFNTLIDAHALFELSTSPDPNLVVLDCRFDLGDPQAGRRAYLNGHIPGAHFADLNTDLASAIGPETGRHPLPDPRAFAANLAAWGVHAASQVVVYDEVNGSFVARAWWLLRWVGHPTVAVLDGGFKAWLAAGGSTAAGEEGRAPHSLDPSPAPARVDSGAVVDAAQVLSLLHDPKRLLVDARAAERYAGSVEPIDAVAGHVAGAVNHPFAANLAADGRFLPPEQLRQRWAAELGGRSPADVVAMCGSGVTACHNLLSLEVAGLHGAKLYAGSWSEWIRDPNRPIATGTA